MQPKFVKRLMKEYNAIVDNPDCPFEAELVNDNIQDWIVTFFGPDDTPYQGLKLRLSIKASVCFLFHFVHPHSFFFLYIG